MCTISAAKRARRNARNDKRYASRKGGKAAASVKAQRIMRAMAKAAAEGRSYGFSGK
jgi:hypothetical protein